MNPHTLVLAALLALAGVAGACTEEGSPQSPSENESDDEDENESDEDEDDEDEDEQEDEDTSSSTGSRDAGRDDEDEDDEAQDEDEETPEDEADDEAEDEDEADADPEDEESPSDAGARDAGRSDAGGGDAGRSDAGRDTGSAGGDACETLTYESFGMAFVDEFCASCHDGTVSMLDLTTLEALQMNADAVKAAAATPGSNGMYMMPPRGLPAPSAAEREQLGEWLDCGPN